MNYYERNGLAYKRNDASFVPPTPEHRAKVEADLAAWRAVQIARGGRLEGGIWIYPPETEAARLAADLAEARAELDQIKADLAEARAELDLIRRTLAGGVPRGLKGTILNLFMGRTSVPLDTIEQLHPDALGAVAQLESAHRLYRLGTEVRLGPRPDGIDSPGVSAIAADLLVAMATNEAAAKAKPVKAPSRQLPVPPLSLLRQPSV